MAQKLYTIDDFATFPDDGLRREIIHGELMTQGAPVTRHQRLSIRLTFALLKHVEAYAGAEIFVAPYGVVFSRTNVVQPDLIVVTDTNAQIVTDKHIEGVPDILIEIVSDSRYDRVNKRGLYEEFGVPEYWVVDPEADRIEVHRLTNGRYDRPEIFEPGDTLSTTILPGLRIDLASLFAR